MDPKFKLKHFLKSGSSLRTLKGWVPKTPAERTRENRELANIAQEMEATVAELSPEMRDDMKTLANSVDAIDAERNLIEYVVSKDHSKQLRKHSRRRSIKDERGIHERFYWIATFLTLVGLYFIFS